MDEYPTQSTGFISRLKNRLSQIEQRTAFDAFLILLIVVGIIATVYLAGQRQIFRSRAAGGSVDVVNGQGQALPKNEDGSVNVETQQIRIKIDFPTEWNSQGFLPSNSAYAQSSQCDGNIYSCSDITCPDGNSAPGTGCYETGGDPNNRYQTECLRNCPVNPASNIQLTPTPTPSSTQQEGCGLPWNGQPTQCSASDNLSNCTYLGAWSRPSQTVCSETTPFCWACPESAQIAPPEQPTAPPPQAITQPPQGEAQPPTPTPEPEEATQSVRISLNQGSVQKDAPCAESPNPSETCKEISVLDLSAQDNTINWQLPSQEGVYPIYIGFISSKGRYKETSLTVSYKTSTSAVSDEKKNDEEGGFLRLFSFQKGKSGETKIKGKLVVLHGDNLYTQQSFRNFLIQHVGQDGVLKYYNLKFKESNVRLPQSGDDIELEGNLEGQVFTVNRILTQVSTPATTSTDDSGFVIYPPILAASGGKKALVTYVRWSDNNQQYFSGDLLKNTILDNDNYHASVSKFLKEASFGNNLEITQLDFSPTEITIPVIARACAHPAFGIPSILTEIDTATRVEGYDIYIYLVAGPNNCLFSGVFPVLPQVKILINNYFFDPQKDREFFSQTIAHEIGHAFGLQHANRIDCKNNGKSVPISRNCQIIEYGDPSSVMGSRYTFLSVVQDFYLRWLSQNDIEKLPYSSEGVTYEKTITAVESSMPGKKLLVVQGPLSGGLSFLPFNDPRNLFSSAYYISFRKRTESIFTNNPLPIPDDFYQGATIQIGPDSSVIPYRASLIPYRVFLINASAGQQGGYTLSNGRNFYDPEQRILIEQLRKDDDTVTVRATYNSDPPPPLPPIIIRGKLKIIANGQKYKDVWISVFKIKNENPMEFGDLLVDYRSFGFAAALPTDQDQEISFNLEGFPDPKYALVPNLMTEDGRHIGAPSRIICPNSPAGSFGCLVNTGSTDVTLTLTIPQ